MRNCLLALVGMVLALGTGELVTRYFELAPEISEVHNIALRLSRNPLLGYEPRPSQNEHPITILANSKGFVDAERTYEKPTDTFRVIVLGDSITASHRLKSYKAGFTFMLETSLRSRGYKVEFINLGVVGYNTQQEVELYKSVGRQYNGDLILLAYCLNDSEHHDGHILASLKRLQAKSFGENTVAEHEYSPFVLKSKLLLLISYRLRLLFAPQKVASNLETEQSTSKNTVEDSLRELKQIANSEGRRMGLVVFPYFRKLEQYAFQQEHESIEKLSVELEIPYLDLYSAFMQCSNGDASLVSFGRFHPNIQGHACAAKAIEQWLFTEKLLPPLESPKNVPSTTQGSE